MRKSEPLSPKADDAFGKALADVCNGILERADAERRGTDAWKKLWVASEHDLKGLLDEASNQTGSIILALASIIQEKFGIKHLSDKLYNLLKALPFAMNHVRDTIHDQQGLSCCADKARLVYYEEVLEEIKKIKATQ